MIRAGAIMALSLTGCAESVASGARFTMGPSALGDVAIGIESVADRQYRTVVRQKFDFSCGSAALATLLHYHYDDPVTEDRVFRGMWRDGDQAAIRRVGFSLLDMKRYLAGRGVPADGYKVTLEQIEKTGVPGIALISIKNYKHFVVIKGISPTEVLIGDPSRGIITVPRQDFVAAWNGVFFVINAAQEQGRRAFNTGYQWTALTRAPVGRQYGEPLSLQALGLTAPFIGDF